MSSVQSRTKLTTRILRNGLDLRGISAEWSALQNRCPTATPFQTPEWLMAWVEAFYARNLVTIEVRDDGHLVGFAPLLVYSRPLPGGSSENVLAFAGGGVSDYLDLLIDPGKELEVLTAICNAALGEPDWSVFELTDLSGESSLLRLRLFEDFVSPHDRGSALILPAEEQLLNVFSKRQRANLRNANSRLRRAGEARIETATSETLSEFLDDLFRLHTSYWTDSGQPGVLGDEQTRRFHQLVGRGLLSRGLLKIHRLRVNDRTIAALHSLWQNETVYCYLQGFDPTHASVSPGTLLMFSAIEEAARSGMRTFDFLRGEESYKRHWRAQSYSTFRATIPRTQFKALLESRSEFRRAA